mgnify:CR=1 FL=1
MLESIRLELEEAKLVEVQQEAVEVKMAPLVRVEVHLHGEEVEAEAFTEAEETGVQPAYPSEDSRPFQEERKQPADASGGSGEL